VFPLGVKNLQQWIIIPIKGLSSGKTRLSNFLTDLQRVELNSQLLSRTLGVIKGVEGNLNHCLVVSNQNDACDLADEMGAKTICESNPCGLNSALNIARSYVLTQNARDLLILACDLPWLHEKALLLLKAIIKINRKPLLIEDKFHMGTNGMWIPTDINLPFLFGGDSLKRHTLAWHSMEVFSRRWYDESLSMDLDNQNDFTLLSTGYGHWLKDITG